MQTPISQSGKELEKLSGIVKRITFHSVETGYTVLKVNSFAKPSEEQTVIVHQSKVFAGVEENIYLRYEEELPQIKDYLKVALFSSYNPFTASLNMSAADVVESNIIESEKSFVLVSNLSKIDKPILIITGRHDDVCPPEEVDYIMDNISSTEKTAVIIPDAGHHTFHHQPALFRKTIKDFISN